MQTPQLSPNPENPRTITPEQAKALRAALAEFGDLGGIVFNRTTKRLVGGHQRVKALGKDAKVVVERKYRKPSPTGTVAEGFVFIDGERFAYREVAWDATKEKAANLAANKGAGEWDLPRLSSWLKDIEEMGFDLKLTMFDTKEIKELKSSLKATNNPKSSTTKAGAKGEKMRTVCPACNHKFVPGWE